MTLVKPRCLLPAYRFLYVANSQVKVSKNTGIFDEIYVKVVDYSSSTNDRKTIRGSDCALIT